MELTDSFPVSIVFILDGKECSIVLITVSLIHSFSMICLQVYPNCFFIAAGLPY